MSERLKGITRLLQARIETTLSEKTPLYASVEPLIPDPLVKQLNESSDVFESRVRGMYKEAVVAPYIGFGIIPPDIISQVGAGQNRHDRYSVIQPYIAGLPMRVIEVLLDFDQNPSYGRDHQKYPSRYDTERKRGIVEETIRRHNGWLEERVFPFDEE